MSNYGTHALDGEIMQREKLNMLKRILEDEKEVQVAYLFGSYARKVNILKSDVDIAILLSEVPKKLLDYSLYLINRLSEIVGDNLDLVILNIAPPMLTYQVIKYGRVIFSRSERVRIMFEVKALKEYLDLCRVLERYDKCLVDQLLA